MGCGGRGRVAAGAWGGGVGEPGQAAGSYSEHPGKHLIGVCTSRCGTAWRMGSSPSQDRAGLWRSGKKKHSGSLLRVALGFLPAPTGHGDRQASPPWP